MIYDRKGPLDLRWLLITGVTSILDDLVCISPWNVWYTKQTFLLERNLPLHPKYFGVITNFWSIVLDDYWSKKTYRPKTIVWWPMQYSSQIILFYTPSAQPILSPHIPKVSRQNKSHLPFSGAIIADFPKLVEVKSSVAIDIWNLMFNILKLYLQTFQKISS